MTVISTGARHRAACRPTTPFTAFGQAVTGTAARRGMLVAASSGLALTMAASTAVAAPEGSALPQVDVSALSSQARTALTVSPTVSVPADVEYAVADLTVQATPPKTTVAEQSDPVAEHVAAAEAERAAAAAAEAQAVAAARSTETASRSTASAPAAQAEAATPAPAPAQSVSGNAIVDIAFRYVGTPYVYGGSSPAGFDCSGFTWYVFQQVGINIPRSSGAQASAGTVVSAAEARPGDLVWWPGHVGIYLGDGQHIAARNPSKPLQAGPISDVGRGTPTFIRVA
ncbi:C40 family peptidase [Georgenia wutianyii]|uniref:C40 family peptidase n=1 Tax=Georgenia wutianyii TaxID=2585135 RepID=UPI001E416ADC|nr:C40 family peptidase [Georgenia wutianyii]